MRRICYCRDSHLDDYDCTDSRSRSSRMDSMSNTVVDVFEEQRKCDW